MSVKMFIHKLGRWPKIPLGLRLFLLYFVMVILTTYFVSSTVMKQIKPTVRQVSEETLVDMAHLLAVMVEDDLQAGTLSQSHFAEQIRLYGSRQPDAAIWDISKKTINHRIYVTDSQGKVLVDSWQQDVGVDFSRWNDVYLTLRGEYGARSTALNPEDPLSTVMHVAAPVKNGDEVIGVVTVAKANRSAQPFIDASKYRVLSWLIVMSIVALFIGALIAWRINTALYKLDDYAKKIGQGEKAQKPSFRVFYEYERLSDALATMRQQLDGKDYVEHYVQTLTHELKSPLSAIKGASEILQMPLSDEKRQLFASNIEKESERVQILIDKLLDLAQLEQQSELVEKQPIDLVKLLQDVESSLFVRAQQKGITFEFSGDKSIFIKGDTFLVQQALFNVFENALDFVNEQGVIRVSLLSQDGLCRVSIYNSGPHIPEYALSRLTERFYSLPRQNGDKSTGLGLNFVEQIMALHNGKLEIGNVTGGVDVALTFKAGAHTP